MDHFYINQICIKCLRGNKKFRVDLQLFDENGRLYPGTDKLDRFSFTCEFCWKKTQLDFYKFSHPDLILHLKRLHEQHIKTKKALDKLYILFNNIKM